MQQVTTMNTTTRSSTAERLGRWLGRGWRGYVRRERRVAAWLASAGVPTGVATARATSPTTLIDGWPAPPALLPPTHGTPSLPRRVSACSIADDVFLHTALQGKAEWLVSGDKDLLEPRPVPGTVRR